MAGKRKGRDEDEGVVIEEDDDGPSREELLGMEPSEPQASESEPERELELDDDMDDEDIIVVEEESLPAQEKPERRKERRKEKAPEASAKEGPPKPERPREKEGVEKRGRRTLAVAVAAVILLAALGSAYLYLYLLPEPEEDLPPTALITMPANATAGHMVSLSAAGSSDDNGIVNYTWDLGDGSKAYGQVAEHFWTGAQPRYPVSLQVRDAKGQTASDSVQIDIDPLVIDVAGTMIGDRGEYNSTGVMVIENPYGIADFDFEGSHITLTKMTGYFNGSSTTEISHSGPMADGFGTEHQVYLEEIEQDFEVLGTAETNSGSVAILGSMANRDRSFIDTTANVTVQRVSNSSFDLRVFLYNREWHSTENVTSYPDLGEARKGFRVEMVRPNGEFDSGDPTPYDYRDGSTLYILTSRGADNVYGQPCVRINVTVDSQTKERNRLTDFFMEFWLADGFSMPVRTHLYARSVVDGNATMVQFTATMEDHERGGVQIQHGSCGQEHFPRNITISKPSYSQEFLKLGTTPRLGNSSSALPANFTLSDAFAFAGSDSSDISAYLGDHPGAYATWASFSEDGRSSTWNVTLAEPGSTEGYCFLVRSNESGNLSLDFESARDIDTPPVNSTAQIGMVLSLSAGEEIMSSEPSAAVALFAGGPDYSAVSFGIEANATYAGTSLLTGLVTDSAEYSYFVESEGSRVAVNALTGQWMYYRESEGESMGFI